MKNLFFIFLLSLPARCNSQAPGFKYLYSGETTGASFVDILWDGEKLITTGQFLTDTAPNNALNGLLYMELDTNGNVLLTDIYFHPNDAVAAQDNNSITQGDNGLMYAANQILYETSSLLTLYRNSERIGNKIYTVDGLQSWLYHCVQHGNRLWLVGNHQNSSYNSEGMLILADTLGNEIWRKYYGLPNLNTGFAEPYILDDNTLLLPGAKQFWPLTGPIEYKWQKPWILAIDTLGNILWLSPR